MRKLQISRSATVDMYNNQISTGDYVLLAESTPGLPRLGQPGAKQSKGGETAGVMSSPVWGGRTGQQCVSCVWCFHVRRPHVQLSCLPPPAVLRSCLLPFQQTW